MLYQCIALEADKPLQVYFESLSDKSYDHQFRVGLDVFDSLQQVKNQKRFFTTFIKNNFVKQYVLEYLFDPAFRIKDSDYAYSLYTNNLKPSFTLHDLQDFVFSQSVLFRYYYLQGDQDKAMAVGKRFTFRLLLKTTKLKPYLFIPRSDLKPTRFGFLKCAARIKPV